MRKRTEPPRRVRAVAAACLAALLAGPARAGDPPPAEPDFDERGSNAFFAEPDAGTREAIEELIQRFASDGVRSRWRARRELQHIGFWTIDPLMDSVRNLEPQVKCASILTLESIGDPRAVPVLRGAMLENASRPYVPGFAALALGRFRDGDSVRPFSRALDSPSTLRTLRVAVPLALARIHTDAARDVLLDQLKKPRARQEARVAQYLALGFFPSAALEPDRPEPSARLRAGLSSQKNAERAAALLGYLVATIDRRDTLNIVQGYMERQKDAEVIQAGLVGLSRYEGAAVSAYLAGVAADIRSDIDVRIVAADLLARRGDPAAKADLERALRKGGNRRLEAALVLALASIEEPSTVDTVISRLSDAAPLVRATAALACAHFAGEAARKKAFEAIDRRLRHLGDKSPGVRRTLRSARAVLSGERTTVLWGDPRFAYSHEIFRAYDRTHEERLLAAVNLRVEACLDLAKVQNLAGDTEVTPAEAEDASAPAPAAEGGEGGEDPGSLSEGGGDESDEAEEGPQIEDPEPTDDPDVQLPNTETDDRPSPGNHLSAGKSRTSPWHELRDLKIHLRERPYFTLADLPKSAESRTPK